MTFNKRDEFLLSLQDAFSFGDLPDHIQKKFSKRPEILSNNELAFYSSLNTIKDRVKLIDLSSGEKQFLIMLAEALLEREANEIFIIDEPEISLHISWQSRLVKDLRRLNPNMQLILVTHSPDIVSISDNNIIRMEEIVMETA